MGLALEVGILGDLKENDEEGYAVFASFFASVNALLEQNNLPPHNEPENIGAWSAGMLLTLHQAVAIADYKTAQEQWDARRFDTERRWQDVPAAALVECQTALSFLDEDRFRYHLPAFMVRGLEDWDNAAGVPLDSCVCHLLHDYPNSLRKSEPAAIAAKYKFNGAQCCAIARFLRLVVE